MRKACLTTARRTKFRPCVCKPLLKQAKPKCVYRCLVVLVKRLERIETCRNSARASTIRAHSRNHRAELPRQGETKMVNAPGPTGDCWRTSLVRGFCLAHGRVFKHSSLSPGCAKLFMQALTIGARVPVTPDFVNPETVASPGRADSRDCGGRKVSDRAPNRLPCIRRRSGGGRHRPARAHNGDDRRRLSSY